MQSLYSLQFLSVLSLALPAATVSLHVPGESAPPHSSSLT